MCDGYFARGGSAMIVRSAGRRSHVQHSYLDIDVFSRNRLAIDLDDIVTNFGDFIVGPGLDERTLNLLKRAVVLGWVFLRLQGQVGRNDYLWEEHD